MFTTKLCLEDNGKPDEWDLLSPLVYAGAVTHTVPARFITNLASIPTLLRAIPFLDVNGLSRRPATLHDWLYTEQILTRENCDQSFYEALLSEGVSEADANIFWLGVRVGGEVSWNERLKRGGGVKEDDFATFEAYRDWLAKAK